MKTGISKFATLGLAVTGLLLCANAQAQIAVVDSLLSGTQVTGTSPLTVNGTVSAGASVLVIDTEQKISGTVDTIPSTLAVGSQTAIDAGYAWSGDASGNNLYDDIYYLYSPTPGPYSISIPVTGTIQEIQAQTFTLGGVNTSITPTYYGQNGNGSQNQSTLTDFITSDAPGDWAAVAGSYGGTILTDNYTSSSGTPVWTYGHETSDSLLGYVNNFANSSDSVTLTAPGGSARMALSALVFTPSSPPIPEPATLALFGIGAALFGMLRFRKNR